MAVVTVCSDFGAQENKVSHCFHCFPIYPPLSYGTVFHDLSLLNGRIILLKKNLRKTKLPLPPSSLNQILLHSWIQNEVVHHHPWHYFQQIDDFEINIFVTKISKIFLWVRMIYLPSLSMDSWNWIILWTCFIFFSSVSPPASTALYFSKEERWRMIILCLEPQTWISHSYIIILLSKIMNHTLFPNSLYFWVILCLKNYSYDSTFSLLHANILWIYKQCRILNFYPFRGLFFCLFELLRS